MNRLRQIIGRRWVRVVLAAVLLPLPVFVLLVNLLLWTGTVEAIVTREGKMTRVQLEHGFAWMLWPTRVHVHDAKLTIDAYSYQLALDVDEALVDMRLLSLFEHRLHFETLRGEGVRAEYRVNIDAKQVGAHALAAYAPFDGTPVQVRQSVAKPVPALEDAWGVDLDDVDAQVDSLWVDEFHFNPVGQIAGGMHWTDGHHFEVTPTQVDPDRATLWLGRHEAVRDLVGTGTLAIAALNPSAVEGGGLPRHVSFSYEGDGISVDPAALTIWWPEITGMVSGSPGPFEADVEATHGVLQPGSRIHHHTTRATVGKRVASMTAAADLVLVVEPDGRPSATVALAGAHVHNEAGELARAHAVHGFVWLSHGDMARPWTFERVHLETGEIVAEDLRKLASFAPSERLKITRGRARAKATVDIGPDEMPIGHGELALEDAAMTVGSLELAASLDTRASARLLHSGEILAELSARSPGITIQSGRSLELTTSLDATANVRRLDSGEIFADLSARAPGFTLKTGGSFDFAAALDTRASVRSLPGGEVLAELNVSTPSLTMRSQHGTTTGTSVRLHDTEVRYRDGELRVASRAEVEDARPAIVHFTHLGPLVRAFPEIHRRHPISTQAKLLVRPDLVDVELEATRRAMHVASVWRKHREHWRLALWLGGAKLGFLASDDENIRHRPHMLVGREWYLRQRQWARQLGPPRQG